MSKKIISLVIVLCMTLSCFCTTFAANEVPESIKILAIGNSFSDDAMQWMYDILTDLGVKDITLGRLFIGGCTLQTHAENITKDKDSYTYYKCSAETNGQWQTEEAKCSVSTATKDEEWDYISLQQASGSSGVSSTYEPYLTQLIDYVKANSNAKLMWHMTWAYQENSTHNEFPKYGNSQSVMYQSIVNAVSEHIVNNDAFHCIIPAGTAIQNMRTGSVADTLTRDGYHMSYNLGRYVVGATWAKSIFNADLSKLKTVPSEEITPEILEEVRMAIDNAVKNPFTVTDLGKNKGINYIDVTESGAFGELSDRFYLVDAMVVIDSDIAFMPDGAVKLADKVVKAGDRIYVPETLSDYISGEKDYTIVKGKNIECDFDVFCSEGVMYAVCKVRNNVKNVPVTGYIRYTAPEELVAMNVIEPVTIGGWYEHQETLEWRIKDKSQNSYDFAFDFVTDDYTYTYSTTKNLAFAEKAEGIVIDGVMSDGEWNVSYKISLDDETQVKNLVEWDGAEDFSADTYIAWDYEKLYFCADITDDYFAPEESVKNFAGGDGIVLGITDDGKYNEIALALIYEQPKIYNLNLEKEVKSDLAVNAIDGKAVYELAIRWEDLLGYSFLPSDYSKVDVSVVFNESDGNGRDCTMEFGTEKPSELFFISGSEPALSVIVDGKYLESNVMFIPFRAMFEALGATVTWDDATETATAVKDEDCVNVTIGSDVIKVNGVESKMQLPVKLINDRTFITVDSIGVIPGLNVSIKDQSVWIYE